MAWLTDEERRENAIRDREAQRQGFSDDYTMRRYREGAALRERLEAVKRRVSGADIETILAAKREGLL